MKNSSRQVLSKFYPARRWNHLSEYDRDILTHVYQNNGFYNAHAHIDRADTLADVYLRHIGTTPMEASFLPLSVKQNIVGDLHKGVAYSKENLYMRMARVIEKQIALGTTRLDTCIDATPDLPEDGLLAVHIALDLKNQFEKKIKIRIAPNPIFGFKEGTPRWDVYQRAAEKCDFLSLLPEKDDYENSIDRNGKIGFREHIRMGVDLACKLKKEVHFHLDQMNTPFERGTEILLEGLRWLDRPKIKEDGPSIKIIHMISPSSYSEERFARLIEGLLAHSVGIIICPTAAISMRQLRSVAGPVHNSIARMLELIKRKVPVWLGTDNINDLFVPQGDGDMLSEIKMGGHALRIATPSIWGKISSGTPLNAVDIATVGRILYEDKKACSKMGPKDWQPAVE